MVLKVSSLKSALLLALIGFLSIGMVVAEEIVVHQAKTKYDDLAPKSQISTFPGIDYAIHRNGLLWTTIHNTGVIGNVFRLRIDDIQKDAPAFYHPRYSRKQHGYFASLWIGGVVDGDTLVSTGYDTEVRPWQGILPIETWPDQYPIGAIEVRSNLPNSEYYHERAKAEIEFHTTYTDTFQGVWFIPDNEFDLRRHRPLGIQVKQTSYSWSANYAADFIIFDYSITNIGDKHIKDAWVGMYYAGCVLHRSEVPSPPSDDIAGYIYSVPHELEDVGDELMRTMYTIDADGNSFSLPWDLIRTASAFSITPLQTPDIDSRNNFNWWIHPWGADINWGPRRIGSLDRPLRLFQGELGQPRSDKDKYYLMSTPEIDYSGYEMAVNHTREGWLEPVEFAGNYARGHFPEMVTSFGPFDLEPGASRPLTLVMAVGDDIHYNRSAFYYTFDTANPEIFTSQLDWSDLVTNIRWAKQVYDNPGVDTDIDGDSGRYVMRLNPLTGDSNRIYYEGDGVPDFRGAQPPPPPDIRLQPDDGRIIVRWDGTITETSYDPMSYAQDFEGYRVYVGRSPSATDAVLYASYDVENFNLYRYDPPREGYVLDGLPMRMPEILEVFGDDFDPYASSHANPFKWHGSHYYFKPVDYNQSDLSDPGHIHKLYPDALPDTTDVDEEGRMRYYQYEFVIEDLLPTVPYWVAVTAFDFGHPQKSLEPLETTFEANMSEVFAIGSEGLESRELDVYVYPNPYRVDANYADRGFENRLDLTSPERARRIYFANLPPKCTISIYSLNGDLVRRLEHNEPHDSGTKSVKEWDLISRNVQMIVSGLYYFVVEAPQGTQIGKFVVLK